jgi:hypothetical protein
MLVPTPSAAPRLAIDRIRNDKSASMPGSGVSLDGAFLIQGKIGFSGQGRL